MVKCIYCRLCQESIWLRSHAGAKDAGIDLPERLLFMHENDIRKIPGIGESAMAEIMLYRERLLRG
jgi:hypothetical protein